MLRSRRGHGHSRNCQAERTRRGRNAPKTFGDGGGAKKAPWRRPRMRILCVQFMEEGCRWGIRPSDDKGAVVDAREVIIPRCGRSCVYPTKRTLMLYRASSAVRYAHLNLRHVATRTRARYESSLGRRAVSPLKERKSAAIKREPKKWTTLFLPLSLRTRSVPDLRGVSIARAARCSFASSSSSSYRVIAEEDHKLDAKGQWAVSTAKAAATRVTEFRTGPRTDLRTDDGHGIRQWFLHYIK